MRRVRLSTRSRRQILVPALGLDEALDLGAERARVEVVADEHHPRLVDDARISAHCISPRPSKIWRRSKGDWSVFSRLTSALARQFWHGNSHKSPCLLSIGQREDGF